MSDSPTALPLGVFSVCAAAGGINPLTCTHFDPTIFLNFRKNVVVSHRVNESIYLVHGTSFRVRPEKGNTGGHGASQRQEDSGE